MTDLVTKPFTKVLVANRGEIARRVFAGCRRLGLASVAVHSDPDAKAPFVAEADEAVSLGGTTAAESYLDFDKVLDAARRTGADAVHPGYGFLAENAAFATAVIEAGLVWIGPPPAAIEAMGSKVGARALMGEAGVPVVPGSELGEGADLAAEAERVGFPLLVKASAGGGGKGMRPVASADELDSAVEGARREAESAFGDPTVFIERLLQRPRHIEIQLLADTHGTTVSLGERECSIQRRHQKVVEEAPSPRVGPELRERLGEAAVAAAEAVGYVGAGTVEFMLDDGGGRDDFFFLEMNTRLQVEHPVTEMVLGLDLVAEQLRIAAGEPLTDAAREPSIRGHAIEVRLYAEDPAAGYLPQTGTLERFDVPGSEPFAVPRGDGDPADLRLDSGFESGSEVSPHYDPMLAKVIAWAPSRGEAASRLAAALTRSHVHGTVTNRDLLVRILRDPGFLAGDTDTGFLDRDEGLLAPLVGAEGRRLHAAAAALTASAERHEGAKVLRFAPAGFRNNFSEPQRIAFADQGSGDGEELEVRYAFRRDGLDLSVGGEELDAVVRSLAPDAVELEFAGIARRYEAARAGDVHFVNSPLGQSSLRELPRFPTGEEALGEGALVAPMPGKVIKLAVTEGAQVEAGDVLVVLEAMKMEHELTAPAAGTVGEIRVAEGDQVESGAALAVVEPPS